MGVYAFAAPIVPGKLDAWRRFCEETAGPRRSERQDSMQRCGITRERAFLQRTPQGDLAIIYLEGEDPEHELSKLLASTIPSIGGWPIKSSTLMAST